MRALAVFTLIALCAACAPAHRAASPESTVSPVPTVAVRGSAPAWRYALPPGWELSQVRVGETAIVLGGQAEVRVLDPATGRLRWQRHGGASAMVLGATAIYGGRTGTVASRALSNGRALWQRRSVCRNPTGSAPAGGVSAIVRNADDVIVGCAGGRVVRIAAASGLVRAESGSAFVAQQVAEIVPLGSCAYGVSGWSDGAALRTHAANSGLQTIGHDRAGAGRDSDSRIDRRYRRARQHVL
ncbi:MAG: PQQ-like domain [Candidatus Eremiobacteraeota bacterium]|jgi:hypothetical protein|nr:PQQ-like domain [Candidatus Eremiobacteraeota bacterium]